MHLYLLLLGNPWDLIHFFIHSCSDSRQRLGELLRQWAAWHADRFPQGYRPPKVHSGRLRYEPLGPMALTSVSTLPVLDDRPAPPSAHPRPRPSAFNLEYERLGDVPKYYRTGAGQLLAKKRSFIKMSSQSTVAAGDGVAEEIPLLAQDRNGTLSPDNETLIPSKKAPSAEQQQQLVMGSPSSAAKRPRLSGVRCFNCGSYAHSLRHCWREYDAEAVEEARRGFLKGGSSGSQRYFEEGAMPLARVNENLLAGGDGPSRPEAAAQEFADLVPGKLSEAIRTALGIGPHDPPPWLQTMRELGIPPAYARPMSASTSGSRQQVKSSIEREEEEGELASMAAPEALQSTENLDFIPVTVTDVEEQQEDAVSFGNGARPRSRTQHFAVQFPGINAPIPPGADSRAWEPPPPPPPAEQQYGYHTAPYAAVNAVPDYRTFHPPPPETTSHHGWAPPPSESAYAYNPPPPPGPPIPMNQGKYSASRQMEGEYQQYQTSQSYYQYYQPPGRPMAPRECAPPPPPDPSVLYDYHPEPARTWPVPDPGHSHHHPRGAGDVTYHRPGGGGM